MIKFLKNIFSLFQRIFLFLLLGFGLFIYLVLSDVFSFDVEKLILNEANSFLEKENLEMNCNNISLFGLKGVCLEGVSLNKKYSNVNFIENADVFIKFDIKGFKKIDLNYIKLSCDELNLPSSLAQEKKNVLKQIKLILQKNKKSWELVTGSFNLFNLEVNAFGNITSSISSSNKTEKSNEESSFSLLDDYDKLSATIDKVEEVLNYFDEPDLFIDFNHSYLDFRAKGISYKTDFKSEEMSFGAKYSLENKEKFIFSIEKTLNLSFKNVCVKDEYFANELFLSLNFDRFINEDIKFGSADLFLKKVQYDKLKIDEVFANINSNFNGKLKAYKNADTLFCDFHLDLNLKEFSLEKAKVNFNLYANPLAYLDLFSEEKPEGFSMLNNADINGSILYTLDNEIEADFIISAENSCLYFMELDSFSMFAKYKNNMFFGENVCLNFVEKTSVYGDIKLDINSLDFQINVGGKINPWQMQKWYGPWWKMLWNDFSLPSKNSFPVANMSIWGNFNDSDNIKVLGPANVENSYFRNTFYDEIDLFVWFANGKVVLSNMYFDAGKGVLLKDGLFQIDFKEGTLEIDKVIIKADTNLPLKDIDNLAKYEKVSKILKEINISNNADLSLITEIGFEEDDINILLNLAMSNILSLQINDWNFQNVNSYLIASQEGFDLDINYANFLQANINGKLNYLCSSNMVNANLNIMNLNLKDAEEKLENILPEKKEPVLNEEDNSSNKDGKDEELNGKEGKLDEQDNNAQDTIISLRDIYLQANIDDMNSARAIGSFSIEDDDLAKIRAFWFLSDILGRTGIPDGIASGNFVLTDIDADFILKNSIFDLHNLIISGDHIEILGDGKYFFNDDNLDLDLIMKIKSDRSFSIASLAKTVFNPFSEVLQIELNGSISDPDLKMKIRPFAVFSSRKTQAGKIEQQNSSSISNSSNKNSKKSLEELRRK